MTNPYPSENSGEVPSGGTPPSAAHPFGSNYGHHNPSPIMSGPPGVVSSPPAPAAGAGYFGYPTPNTAVSANQQLPSGIPARANDDRARRWLPLLMIATTVFLATTVLMTVLYLIKSGDFDAQRGELTSARAEAAERKAELQRIARELGRTENELDDSEDLADELAEEKNVIKQCMQGLGLLQPRNNQDQQQDESQISPEVLSVCAEAFQILGIPLGGRNNEGNEN